MDTLDWYKVNKDNLDNLPETSGIYIFSVLLKSGNYGVFYVGQSENIRKRVKEHFSSSESNGPLKSFLSNDYTFKISYAKCLQKSLDKYEKYLISYYDPKYNDKEGNGNESSECSLPNVVVWDK